MRPYDWQFGASVQHELVPRLSVEAGYNRRWWGNFFVTDNVLTTAADYDTYGIVIPQHENLPGGGQHGVVRGDHAGGGRAWRPELHDERDRLRRRAHGVLAGRGLHRDGAAGQRPHRAGRHQHGTRRPQQLRRHPRRCPSCSARRGSIRATSRKSGRPRSGASPRTRSRRSTCWSAPACGRSKPPRAAASPPTGCRWPRTTSCRTLVIAQSLGRLPANALATGTTTVNLLNPGELYTLERINLVDMRFAKILRFGGPAAGRRRRPVQPVQLERHHQLSADLRVPDQRRRVADADGDRGAASRAVPRDVQLLIHEWLLPAGRV